MASTADLESSAQEPSAEPRKRGYPWVHPAIEMASVHLLSRLGVSNAFLRQEKVDFATYLMGSGKDPEGRRYLQAALDFLDTQHFLREAEDGNYVGFRELRYTLQKQDIIGRIVDTYAGIVKVMEDSLGLEDESGERTRVAPQGVSQLFNVASGDQRFDNCFRMASIPAAATFFHETGLSRPLANGESIKPEDIAHETRRAYAEVFFEFFRRLEILETDGTHVKTTDRGSSLFKLGSYPELILSYYDMLANLDHLRRGEVRYGFEKDIYRHGEFNARASNGMTAQCVAPYIVDATSTIPVLQEKMAGGGVYIDYGSGGGDMLVRMAQAKETSEMPHLFGIDFNHRATSTAARIVRERGLNDRVHLTTGSILDAVTLQCVAEEIRGRGFEGRVIASINAILHDIGSIASKEFLRLHARVFGDAPLIVTEILRMPMAVIRRYPDYQAASFQFFHDASGQQLYQEEELAGLLYGCGYEILEQKVHASMPGERGGERLNTIVTWVVQYKL